jgi:DNA-binding transcriptional MerR regulator
LVKERIMMKYYCGKNKLTVLLILLMIVSTALIGCGAKEKVDQALIPDNNSSTTTQSKENVASNDAVSRELADRAKTEGVSIAKMERMIEELTAMTAEKYDDTYENYVVTLKAEGKTPFEEFATAADNMGITIKEYYEYEKQKPEMSEKDKETMQGMQQAVKELKDIDISALEEQANTLQKNAQAMENSGNTETTGNILELAKYEVLEVVNEENDRDSGYYGIEYKSEKEASDVVSYFKDFLEGTANYFIMDSSPAAAVVSGTVNGKDFEVSLERDFENKITNITVVYHGEIEN